MKQEKNQKTTSTNKARNNFVTAKEKVTDNVIKKLVKKSNKNFRLFVLSTTIAMAGFVSAIVGPTDFDELFPEKDTQTKVIVSSFLTMCAIFFAVIIRSMIKTRDERNTNGDTIDIGFLEYTEIKKEDIQKAIDLIVQIKQDYPEIPAQIDVDAIKRLADVLPIVIKNMSEQDKATLDTLCAGDKKVLDDKGWYAKASKVFEKHFINNPQDLELVIDAYKGIAILNAQMFEKSINKLKN